jgi:hypothetical protein
MEKALLHVLPQSMPAGALVTVPEPDFEMARLANDPACPRMEKRLWVVAFEESAKGVTFRAQFTESAPATVQANDPSFGVETVMVSNVLPPSREREMLTSPPRYRVFQVMGMVMPLCQVEA